MNTEQFQTMVSMCQYLGIQILLFDETFSQIENIDYGFRKKMLKDFDYQIIANAMQQSIESNVFYLYEDDMHLHYTLFRFSEEDAKTANCQVLCIGPILYQPISSQFALELVEKLDIPSRYEQDFIEYFNRVPIVPYYDLWNHLIAFFISQCDLPMKDMRQVNQDTLKLSLASDYRHINPDMPDVALKTIEERYQWENMILSAVSTGKTQQAIDAHYQFRQYKLLPRVPDPIRNHKNFLFTFNTLLRKAVEQAKVHPYHIDRLSTQFAVQIETALTPEQLDSLAITMIRKYCMLVKNYSRRSYSLLVQTCMDYVDFHYNANLSLASLAAMCYVSPSYLSTLFKKEAGMTITDYINNTRIHQSLIYLNASNLSMSEIASRCGFSDANYFSRTFKKIEGKTPKAYRDAIQN